MTLAAALMVRFATWTTSCVWSLPSDVLRGAQVWLPPSRSASPWCAHAWLARSAAQHDSPALPCRQTFTTYSQCGGWQTYDTVLTKYDFMVLKARERGVRPPSQPSYKWDRCRDTGQHARALPPWRTLAPPAPPVNCSWRRPRAVTARLAEVHELLEAVDLAALVRHVCGA